MCRFSMFKSFMRRTLNIRLFDRFANRVKGFASRGSPGRSHVSVEDAFYVATPLGFEPRITPPKGAVLPLHHGVMRICNFRFAIFDSSAMAKIRGRLGLPEAT